jgi:modulator of FtsH protease HflK
MKNIPDWMARFGVLLNEGGPWGPKRGGGESGGPGNGGGGDGGDGGGPRNPWSQPPGGGRPRKTRGASAMDQLTDQLRGRFGSGGGGGGFGNSGPIIRYAIIALLLLWLFMTSLWQIGSQQVGVVTRFGKYVGKLDPGVSMTFPAPIDRVQKVDIQEIRNIDIPEGTGENLILTSDRNLIDLAYTVRWGVRYPEFFLFQLAKPEDTVKEAAESAMREVISSVSLTDALGPGRAIIEQRVALRMQQILDDYKSGVAIRGVVVKPADPPAAVNDAFKLVSAKQQEKQANINNANAYAQQVLSRAKGEAVAFDKVYAQYKLAPGVTRKRMYYETMEAVLANTDKTIIESNTVAPYLPLGRSTAPRVTVEEPQK